MKCLQCNSEDIVRNIKPADSDHNGLNRNLSLIAYTDPNALIFKGGEKFPLMANVCADCGYVMFSVSTADAKAMKRIQTSF